MKIKVNFMQTNIFPIMLVTTLLTQISVSSVDFDKITITSKYSDRR